MGSVEVNMTDRDHFAAAALTGLLAQDAGDSPNDGRAVAVAYEWADAMLAAREK